MRALVDAGMDVARMNFSHGTQSDHKQVYDMIRSAAAERIMS
jgi:pyruvate kinase